MSKEHDYQEYEASVTITFPLKVKDKAEAKQLGRKRASEFERDPANKHVKVDTDTLDIKESE